MTTVSEGRTSTVDWTGCPAISRRAGYLSGVPTLEDDPRVTPETIVENMDAGESPATVVALFQLRTKPQDLLQIHRFAQAQRARAARS